MLRKNMDYNDRFRLVVKEFGRQIVIELNRGIAEGSDEWKDRHNQIRGRACAKSKAKAKIGNNILDNSEEKA